VWQIGLSQTDTGALNSPGGSFEGPRLPGELMPEGEGWLLVRSDGVLEQDVRITLKTDDEAFIYVHYG
jgi:hypothetical protein